MNVWGDRTHYVSHISDNLGLIAIQKCLNPPVRLVVDQNVKRTRKNHVYIYHTECNGHKWVQTGGGAGDAPQNMAI